MYKFDRKSFPHCFKNLRTYHMIVCPLFRKTYWSYSLLHPNFHLHYKTQIKRHAKQTLCVLKCESFHCYWYLKYKSLTLFGYPTFALTSYRALCIRFLRWPLMSAYHWSNDFFRLMSNATPPLLSVIGMTKIYKNSPYRCSQNPPTTQSTNSQDDFKQHTSLWCFRHR